MAYLEYTDYIPLKKKGLPLGWHLTASGGDAKVLKLSWVNSDTDWFYMIAFHPQVKNVCLELLEFDCNAWNYTTVYILLVSRENTWYHVPVSKLFVSERNTWCHITEQIIRIW